MPSQPDYISAAVRSDNSRGEGIESGRGLVTEAGIAFPSGPCRRAGVTFADAEAVISGGCGDDGEGDWAFDAYCQQRDREVAALSAWADERELCIAPEALNGVRRGGVEHLILPLSDPMDGAVSRLVKLTKGESFGFSPTCDDASSSPDDWFPPKPATPAQYLRRMALLNELRPEMETCLEGFAVIDGKLRVVTSQLFIEPVAASPKAIQAFLRERGFLPVNDSAWYHAGHGLALFDVRPANVLEHDGLLYPVDIMPLVPGARMKALILEAMKRRG